MEKTLVVIPARANSKGIPGKNIKLLNGKPLIQYSIEFAMNLFPKENICVTTDSLRLIDLAKELGLSVPFVRPDSLSDDNSGMHEVLVHAINHYKKSGRTFNKLLLLQPTSPFRKAEFIPEIFSLYTNEIDMVVSVNESKSNPYYNLFEEDEKGFLSQCIKSNFTRRQDCPTVYEQNGSLYLINISRLEKQHMGEFKKIKKYVVATDYALDLDTIDDWALAEFLSLKKTIE